MCMTRMSDYPADEPLTVTPMKAFPLIKDLVTDVSWNYEVNKRIPAFQPRAPDFPDGTWRMYQYEIERPQEFRKCIECFLCQDVCHVLRTHEKHEQFMGPAMLVRAAVYEMHPLDEADRRDHLRHEGGIGFCNITKCCTEVCPESITIHSRLSGERSRGRGKGDGGRVEPTRLRAPLMLRTRCPLLRSSGSTELE